MENRRAGHRVGAGFGAVHNIIAAAHAAAADHRNVDRFGDGLDELQIHAALKALVVHAHQQDLSCPQRFAALGPFNHIQPRVLAAVVVIGFPLAALGAAALGLSGKHHALAAEGLGHLGDQRGALDGSGVDGGLVGAHA